MFIEWIRFHGEREWFATLPLSLGGSEGAVIVDQLKSKEGETVGIRASSTVYCN